MPDWDVAHLKAKIDTGARTSSLHAFGLEWFDRDGNPWVRFEVHPWQRSTADAVTAEAAVVATRDIRSSSGEIEHRPVVHTSIVVAGRTVAAEITLTRRDEMGFRMLVGREALRKRFLVDPGMSYRGGRPDKSIRRRNRSARRRANLPVATTRHVRVISNVSISKGVTVKVAILSRAPRSYSTQRLKLAALDRGHQCKVLDTLRFAIDLSGDEPDLQFRGKPLSDYDAVMPRIGASITYFGSAVVRQFEQMDVFTPNTANGITNSRDKLRAIQILSRHDIGMPKTAFVRNRQDVLPAIERVGGAPVVIKLLEGTQGIGVILAPDKKVAEAIIETLHNTKQNVLIQQFVAESKGRDIRALVVGDRVVAAMRRTAEGDEFRSNVHRGGSVESVALDPEYERTAVRSAQIMGLRVAGVDMLEGNDGPLVMEVNSSPGLEGIERATELDVAGAIIDHVANQVAFPELDVRQRLTVSTGYGVAELLVREASDFVGNTIGDSGLRDRDITVLTLHRDADVIPNPRDSRILEANDRLLCFGNLEQMRDMIPARRRRRARLRKLPEHPLPESE